MWSQSRYRKLPVDPLAYFFLGKFFTALNLNDGCSGHIDVACDFVPLYFNLRFTAKFLLLMLPMFFRHPFPDAICALFLMEKE